MNLSSLQATKAVRKRGNEARIYVLPKLHGTQSFCLPPCHAKKLLYLQDTTGHRSEYISMATCAQCASGEFPEGILQLGQGYSNKLDCRRIQMNAVNQRAIVVVTLYN